MYSRAIRQREKGAHRYDRYTTSGIRSQGTNFIQQFEPVHTGHFNVGQRQIRDGISYRPEALKRVARHHDFCPQLTQEKI